MPLTVRSLSKLVIYRKSILKKTVLQKYSRTNLALSSPDTTSREVSLPDLLIHRVTPQNRTMVDEILYNTTSI